MKRNLFLLFFFVFPFRIYAYEKVRFRTPDGCVISAYYQKSSSSSYVFINAHGLGSTKEEWIPFQKALVSRGFGFLSFDIRGHGESLRCGKKSVNYKLFSSRDWLLASNDFLGAVSFLRGKGVSRSKMVFCGASVGSSLALLAGKKLKGKINKYILLSPGVEYAGIKAGEALASLEKSFIIVAASPRDKYAWVSSGILLAIAGEKGMKTVFFAGRGGHGVNMFKTGGKKFLEKLLSGF